MPRLTLALVASAAALVLGCRPDGAVAPEPAPDEHAAAPIAEGTPAPSPAGAAEPGTPAAPPPPTGGSDETEDDGPGETAVGDGSGETEDDGSGEAAEDDGSGEAAEDDGSGEAAEDGGLDPDCARLSALPDCGTASAGAACTAAIDAVEAGDPPVDERWWPGLEAGTVALADFDDDNHLDVAQISADETVVSLFVADAGAPRSLTRSVAVPLTPLRIATGDLDGDGLADAFVAGTDRDGQPGGLALIASVGKATLETGPVVRVAADTTAMVIADFDRDGAADIVTAGRGPVLVGFGDGGARFERLALLAPPSGSVVAAHALDVDQDGDLDLVITGRGGEHTSWLVSRNDGRGVFHTDALLCAAGLFGNERAGADGTLTFDGPDGSRRLDFGTTPVD